MFGNINHKIFKITLLGILALEMLSWIAWSTQNWNQIFLGAILLITLALALYRLEWGIYIVLAELIIGSKGYLLSWPLGSWSVSLRLGLFLVVFLAYLIWLLRDRKIKFFQTPLWKPYLALLLALGIAVGIGYLNHNDWQNIFLDWNGYLYLGLIFPLTQCLNKEKLRAVWQVVWAGAMALIAKTLILLFIFSQIDYFGWLVQAVYKWVRDTGVGEITLMSNGFYRIFLQSHIYLIIVFFIVLAILLLKKYRLIKKSYYLMLALSLLIIFLGYSRSFWLGTAVILGLVFLAAIIILKLKWSKILSLLGILILAFIIDYGLILGLVNFPMPGNDSISAASLVSERTKDPTAEAAGSSRLELLKPLFSKIMDNPATGFGFGTTVTYPTKDPRALVNNPDGLYTTYAFEWGYLDLWLKLGLWGLLIYGWLIWSILKKGWQKFRAEKNPLVLGSLLGLAAILVIHFFTPYLNHPLGLGWLMLCGIYFTQVADRK